MDVNLELYKTFYYVAKHLSFTKAAEELFVTQSSISQSIKQLENKMDVALFHRNNRKITLSHEGEMLFTHVSQALSIIWNGERNIENAKVLEYGELNFGASDTICRYFLLPYIRDFHVNYPNIKINITNQSSVRTMNTIKRGELDFGIVNLPYDTLIKDINVTVINTFNEVLIGSRKYFENLDKITKAADLLDYPLITLTPNTSTRKYLDAMFEKQGINLKPEFELESIDLIIDLVKIGLGIGFVMDAAVDLIKDPDIVIIPLKETLPSREVAFISNTKLPLSISSQKFRMLFEKED